MHIDPRTPRPDRSDTWGRRLDAQLTDITADDLVGIDTLGDVTWVLRHRGLASLWGMVAPIDTFALAIDARLLDAPSAPRHVVVLPDRVDLGENRRERIVETHPAVDIARRILRRPTAPEERGIESLTIVSWLELVLDRAADPRTSASVRRWGDICALHPGSGGDRTLSPTELAGHTRRAAQSLGWDRLRRGVAAGDVVIAGADSSDASWMDGPMFARHLLSTHRDVGDLLADLELFIDEALHRLVSDTVSATNSKVSPFNQSGKGP